MTQLSIAQFNARRRRELRANPVQLFRVDGTGYKLAVPYSIECNRYSKAPVCLLGHPFKLVEMPRGSHPGLLQPLEPLPASWLVDLSCEAPESEVAA